jgi:hypothetical protein
MEDGGSRGRRSLRSLLNQANQHRAATVRERDGLEEVARKPLPTVAALFSMACYQPEVCPNPMLGEFAVILGSRRAGI